MKVLVVDDEVQLADAIVEILKRNKFTAEAVYDGEDGYDCALTGIYDVIVLDIMLPKMNGIDVLSKLRRNRISTPVLMLSAKSEVNDKVLGLDTGADDYLAKPFSADELVARVKALTRRKEEYTGNFLTAKGLKLNKDTHELACNNETTPLSVKEYQIMEMLMSKPDTVFPKERLVEKVWGYDTDAEYNTIEVYVSFLRRKLSALNSPVSIKSLRGLGYKLE